METMYPFTITVTLLAVLIYMWMGIQVGRARLKYGVDAPATDGAPEFRRTFRVHVNTLEGLASFLPSLWIFAIVASDSGASILGLVWCIGRIVYALGYYKDAEKRVRGAVACFLSTIVLVLGSVVAIIWPHI